MAKPGKRSKNSKRPTYNKILKQQEVQEDGGEDMIDQIAALEALLGGGLPEPEESTEVTVDPEEQARLLEERAARKAELAVLEEKRLKARGERNGDRGDQQKDLIKQQEDREARYKEEQEKLKEEFEGKKELKKKIAEGKKELKRLQNVNKIGKLSVYRILIKSVS